jgi:methanogenic corrinoid protein MtbC1
VTVSGLSPVERVARILAAAADYRIGHCERWLADAREQLPAEVLVRDVLAPVLREAGNRWHNGELSIVQEHLLSSAVRRQLFYALDRYSTGNGGPGIAFTTLSGERHELGSLMLAVVTASRGYRAIYLGADLPVDEVGRFCARVSVAAVALSLVTSPEVIDAYAQIDTLRALLPSQVAIWVGGQAARLLDTERLPANTFRMTTMQQFDERLSILGARNPAT